MHEPDTPCVIIDVTGFDDWPTSNFGTKQLGRNAPTVLQPSRETAEREAARLAKAHPGKRFAVFAVTTLAEAREVPTHVTLGGQVLQRRLEAFVTPVTDADQIPF